MDYDKVNASEAIKLIKDNSCPACGPSKIIAANRAIDYGPWTNSKLCMCCGRIFTITEQPNLRLQIVEEFLSIESFPPTAGLEYPYTCAIDHPEHKWPIQYGNPDAEPLTEDEKAMQDGEPMTRENWRCCSVFAQARVNGFILWHDTHWDIVSQLAERVLETRYCFNCGCPLPR